MRFLDRIKFKLQGRSVPAIKCQDVDVVGRVNSLQMYGAVKDRPNSLLASWNGEVWEKNPENPPINVTLDNGTSMKMWVVGESGTSCSIFTRVPTFPNKEKLQGAVSNMDDFAEALQIKPTMREKVMFMILGILMGVFIVQPMLATFLK
jgi:hypothetical protein